MQDLRLIQALNDNFSIKKIKYLLDQGITTNAVDSTGNSALHFAINNSRGNASVVDIVFVVALFFLYF
ncbi:MAG TPA: ankyrin repeat domain-containing protein [Rickettsia endosymbiont of Diachasma alloeum]|nr:ankyrin repeat domain-containing protein [Rickettsia endosymbiont of Diachasma alloeum]